ncbi:MAG: thiolase domain-containing protein [Nitrososphaerales archaeon]
MKVFIASIGMSKVGDLWDKSLVELALDAGFKALNKFNLKPDSLVIGNMFSGYACNQEHLGALIADSLGLTGISAYKVEAACSSGAAALASAYSRVKSGDSDVCLVIGVEKMRDMSSKKASNALAMAESAEFTQFFGANFISLNAMLTRYYMNELKVSREELAYFPLLAHKNAKNAEHAQFRREISLEDIKKAPIIADPLGLLECSPIGDGAASVLLVSERKAKEIGEDNLVEIIASSIATNRFSFYERNDMLRFEATERATNQALEQAKIKLDDIDFVEVHDAFPVVTALSLEAMGFVKKGEAPKLANQGFFDLKGELPICTFGGLKARGHPAGATGIYQACEAYLQLTYQAKSNQVEKAGIGMIHNVGGIDTTAIVHILKRNRA